MEPAICGYCRSGYFRCNIVRPTFERLLKRFQNLSPKGQLDFSVTHRKLVLGSRDTTTGHCAKEYEKSTINMVVLPRGSQYLSLVPGILARDDAVGICVDPVNVGDQIKKDTVYYEVTNIRFWEIGNSFEYRECQLHELPLFEEA